MLSSLVGGRPAPERQLAGGGMTDGPRQAQATILIVDDEQPMRRILRSMLAPSGHQVIEAEDGQAALDTLLATRSIDLVVLDVMMPNIDGIEVCRRIRQDLGLLTLPIVFVTAAEAREMRIRGKEAGGDDFLTKPIDPVELLARVRNLLLVKSYHDLQAEQKTRLELEVNAAREQIVRLGQLASLGTLAGCVGHELGNLAGIYKGSLRFVQEALAAGKTPDPADLERLTRVGEHLTNHAQNLLRLGRPEADTKGHADLCAVTRQTLDMLALAGRTKRVRVVLEAPDQPVMASASRASIEQLVINLVSNAADELASLTDRAGVVTVTLDAPTPATVRLAVSDNGRGIPPELRERIFEPYFSTKAPGQGTGLGLTVVRQLAQMHHGTVGLESTVGQGSVFCVTLPRPRD